MNMPALLFLVYNLTSFNTNPLKELSATKYIIDPGHTAITIRVQRFGVVDVLGRFPEVSGSIQYDPSNPSATRAEVIIQVNSYTAHNQGGEDAVKGKAFLDAASYPEIRFVSKRAYTRGNQVLIVGDLTVHGTTQEVEFPFTITGPRLDLPSQKQSIGIEAGLEINRMDYGVSFDRKHPQGGELIGSKVNINLLVLAIAE